MKTKKMFIIGKRPNDIPENWLIFNAPRPLLGDKEWQGDFQHGIFYVAVDPDGYIPEKWIERNCDLDGWLVEYISKTDAILKIKEHYFQEYPNMEDEINNLGELALLQAFNQNFNTLKETKIILERK